MFGKRPSNTEIHAQAGPGMSRTPVIGAIAAILVIFVIFSRMLSRYGVTAVSEIAGAMTVGVLVLLLIGKRVLRKLRLGREAKASQAREMEKKAAFDDAFEMAKQNGDFERFGKQD